MGETVETAELSQLVGAARQSVLDARLAASGLPEHWRSVVKSGLPADFAVADLDAGIARVKAAWAADEASRTVQGIRASARAEGAISGMQTGLDRITEAFAALVEGRRPKQRCPAPGRAAGVLPAPVGRLRDDRPLPRGPGAVGERELDDHVQRRRQRAEQDRRQRVPQVPTLVGAGGAGRVADQPRDGPLDHPGRRRRAACGGRRRGLHRADLDGQRADRDLAEAGRLSRADAGGDGQGRHGQAPADRRRRWRSRPG